MQISWRLLRSSDSVSDPGAEGGSSEETRTTSAVLLSFSAPIIYHWQLTANVKTKTTHLHHPCESWPVTRHWQYRVEQSSMPIKVAKVSIQCSWKAAKMSTRWDKQRGTQVENVSVSNSHQSLLKQIKTHKGLARWDGTGLVAANWLRLNLSCQVKILQSKMISKSWIKQHEHKTEQVYLHFQHFGSNGQTGWSSWDQKCHRDSILQYTHTLNGHFSDCTSSWMCGKLDDKYFITRFV